MKRFFYSLALITLLSAGVLPTYAQTTEGENEVSPTAIITASTTQTFTEKTITLNAGQSTIPEGVQVEEVLWNLGDGVQTTGEEITHAYKRPGTYTVRLIVRTDRGVAEDRIEVSVYDHVMILLADSSAPEEAIEVKRAQAAKKDLLLLVLRPRSGGPEVVVEEELTTQLLDARDAFQKAPIILTWTSGSVGASVLSKFAQRVRQAEGFVGGESSVHEKGFIILSDTPFGVLAPTAQSIFDQLEPAYVMISRPQALDLLLEPYAAETAKQTIISQPISHRLLGPFSARTIEDVNILNFFSFGINYLVNRGVPLSSITLILMLPIIATILSFSRQVVGIKAFGIVTPAMTTLSFLVMGLQYGLIVFSAVLLAGTLTRLVMRKFHLLYLPRMALVLTSVSFAILLLFALGVALNNNTLLSFSIFPILILTLLAEEFISVQFTSGFKRAFTITAWTLALSILCYYIVSWELLRTLVISYPEVTLLALPLNVLLGRWGGLRVTEYFRFRKLLRYVQQ